MINIAIDGPSGAGKSTIAKQLAKKLNILYLDTGAMYRAVGLKVKQTGIDINDESQLQNLLDKIDIDIQYKNGEQRVFLDQKDVSTQIREHDISKYASDVSAKPICRLFLVQKQRLIAQKNNCVLDGRDIGTFVLPNADLKIFLTASAEVRAKRRYAELLAKGDNISYDTVYFDMLQRDANDTNRTFAPLKQAEHAQVIDSSLLSIDQVLNIIDSFLQQKNLK